MLNLGLSPIGSSGGRKGRASAHQYKAEYFKPFCQLVCFLSLMVVTPSSFAGVIINEIMYHPASGNLLESYVELRNTDNVSTNISGWRFTKGIAFTFPTNTTLGPGAYLVVAADRAAFTNKYPGV